MASEVSLFSRLISVMISCADLFSCFWFSSPSMSSSSRGRIFSTRNFLSSCGFFFTFSLNSATSAISAARSFANTSWSLLVSAKSAQVSQGLPLRSLDGTWHCPTARPVSSRTTTSGPSTFVQLQQLQLPPIQGGQGEAGRKLGAQLGDDAGVQVSPRVRIINFINIGGMKEETPDQQHQENGVIYGGEGRCLEPVGTAAQVPGARFKHQSFLYKGRLYVHGGTTIPSNEFTDDPLELHCYHFEGEEAGRWERIRTRVVGGKQLEVVSAHAGAVGGNKWYVFGGSNNECRPTNQLLRLNLESYEWARLEQKGEVPSPRESAFLAYLQKNWLVLYGGLSTSQVQIYNTFHFYNLDTRNWSLCDGSYQYQVYARLDPALTHFRDRLYLFGGTYRTIINEERYLDDFYEIGITTPARNQSGKVQMKRLTSPKVPEGRSGHCLVGVGQHHLALIGGENTNSQLREGLRFEEVNLVHSMWLFDTRCATWNRLELALRGFRFRSMATCVNRNDHLYLFGGIHNYSAVLNDLVELTIDPHALVNAPLPPRPCLQCKQRARFPPALRFFPARMVEEVAQTIDFPFAAFGLLIDNAMNSGASLLKISHFQAMGSQRLRLLKIEDDAKLNWSDEELLETVSNFNAGPLSAPAGTDKKIKAGLVRQQFRREYGYNLKAASLRLGNGFLFISYNGDESLFRVFYLEKQDAGHATQRYCLYYYSLNILQRRVCKPEMEAARKYITERGCGDLIDSVFFHRKCRNTLIIFNPRIQDTRDVTDPEEEVELKADLESNNILNGPLTKIRDLERRGCLIQECLDVSLRAYISYLYLKNDSMKIMLSVKETSSHPIEVQTQAYLDKVDRLCKQKHVLQINGAFEFDLKITEIYYLYDLKRKINFFNNGLLIYHKNRLVTRFKYPLGELLFRKYYKHEQAYNFIQLFGFIELPDHIPINLFKTSYLHHIMMEKLFSRLKFISKSFKQQLVKMAKDPDYRRPAPTKLNQQQAKEEKNEISEPKPVKERRRTEPLQREISLRRRKTPQQESIEQKLKHMLKNPTSDNIKQIMKLIELNSDNQEDILVSTRKRQLYPPTRTGGIRPVSSKSVSNPNPNPDASNSLLKQKPLEPFSEGKPDGIGSEVRIGQTEVEKAEAIVEKEAVENRKDMDNGLAMENSNDIENGKDMENGEAGSNQKYQDKQQQPEQEPLEQAYEKMDQQIQLQQKEPEFVLPQIEQVKIDEQQAEAAELVEPELAEAAENQEAKKDLMQMQAEPNPSQRIEEKSPVDGNQMNEAIES